MVRVPQRAARVPESFELKKSDVRGLKQQDGSKTTSVDTDTANWKCSELFYRDLDSTAADIKDCTNENNLRRI